MKIGFLGAGHLGSSMIEGLIRSKKFSSKDLKIVIKSENSLAKFQKLNFQVSQDWEFLLDCDLLILALKPDDIIKMKEKLSSVFSDIKIVVSVAAGVSIRQLQEIFKDSAITRAMPNTSCKLFESMTMIVHEGHHVANDQALAIFNLLGKTIVLSEDKIHVFIAICGSASAYLYYWLQPLILVALENGFQIEDSKLIISQLLVGVSSNIAKTSSSLLELQEQVTVLNGTTIEAIKVFDAYNLNKIISEAISSVIARSKEL